VGAPSCRRKLSDKTVLGVNFIAVSQERESRLKTLGLGALVPLGILAALALVALLLRGMVWASEKALPWLTTSSEIALGICVFILLPLCISRRTRPWAGFGFYFASYLFGMCLFAFACIVDVQIWGYGGLAVGLVFAGIGVVPVAILATLLHAEWQWLLNLFISIIITFGARALGIWLTTPARGYEEPVFEEDIVIEAEKGAGQ
jgi:hypothetical protein